MMTPKLVEKKKKTNHETIQEWRRVIKESKTRKNKKQKERIKWMIYLLDLKENLQNKTRNVRIVTTKLDKSTICW